MAGLLLWVLRRQTSIDSGRLNWTDFIEHTCSLEGPNCWINYTIIQWYRQLTMTKIARQKRSYVRRSALGSCSLCACTRVFPFRIVFIACISVILLQIFIILVCISYSSFTYLRVRVRDYYIIQEMSTPQICYWLQLSGGLRYFGP